MKHLEVAQYKELQEQKRQLTQQFEEIQQKYEIESNRLVIMKEAQNIYTP